MRNLSKQNLQTHERKGNPVTHGVGTLRHSHEALHDNLNEFSKKC